MRLRVLGNPDRYLAPFADGTGYLVEHAGDALLLDCGPGVHAARDLEAAAADVRAVVVSHMHHDHAGDLLPVLAALPGARLLLPPGGAEAARRLAEAHAFQGPFDHPGGVQEAAHGDAASAGALRLRAAATRHSAPSLAWRVEAGGRVLVYASDTAPCDALRDLARGADALLAHTLLPRVEPGSDHARIHSTAETAAALAEEAGVARLLLSHRFHGEPDGAFVEAAAARTKARVVLLRPGERVEI